MPVGLITPWFFPCIHELGSGIGATAKEQHIHRNGFGNSPEPLEIDASPVSGDLDGLRVRFELDIRRDPRNRNRISHAISSCSAS